MDLDVATLGEALIGLDSGGGRIESARTLTKSVGGAESNTVIGLSRLGHRTAFMGRVGDDPFGREVERTLRGEGVDVSRLERDVSRPTGLLLKERWDSRVSVYYYRTMSAGSALDASDVDLDLVARARVLHLTGVTLALGQGPRKAALTAATAARAAGVQVSLDANFRHKMGTSEELVGQFNELAPLADHILLSWSDAVVCAGSAEKAAVHDYACRLGAPTVVVKGARGGAVAFVDGNLVAEVEPSPAVVVDPVGAGDGFAVGYLHGVLTGADIRTRLAIGAWVAGRAIGHCGDYEGLPLASELAAELSPETSPRPGVAR
ncbi:sugar kinase [Blastococcus xanthinilyticus]|uniref:2-dehydro-3-deoxygluconokinase n=1 Tax=Blastococcus xanthinilyticus TaxID=1564164 RepID=A0A5S5CV48_9ACTN|nr:sugar kinase [Blastococcus xanthinilyticus]TYP87593.1 2-dehydro-3-deoxygluconokinase [Blastococcus xanthinilyticus]